MRFLFFLFFTSLYSSPIDIVIPCHYKDREKLPLAIAGAKRYIKNARNVYVISSNPFTKKGIWIDEKKAPFSTLFFGKEATHPIKRWGWTFQQLLKLYAFEIIPNLSENILILDADTVFINPVTLITNDNKACYTLGGHVHEFYITFTQKLIPNLTRFYPNESAITHHMLLQKPLVESLFKEIRTIHKMEPFEAFLSSCLDGAQPSEFELYFNFVFRETEQVVLRPLLWKDTRSLSFKNLRKYKKKGYHFVSNHH